MKRGSAVLASVFVFYTNTLLTSAAQRGSSTKVSQCNDLPLLDGGYWRRGKSGYARLICNEGYVLKNPKVRLVKCVEVNQNERNWSNPSGEFPTCRKLAVCPDPGSPAPGTGSRTPEDGPFHEDSTVSFECEEEFELVGQETIRCQEDSTWDFPRARCKRECPNPGVPINGLRSGTDSSNYQTGDVVQFSCNPDFTLEGSASRTCQDNGIWDGEEPFCRERYDVNRPEDDIFGPLDEPLETQNGPLKGYVRTSNWLEWIDEDVGRHVIYYLVFDSSDSVGNYNFLTSIKFAAALIRRVGVSDHYHVRLVTYGSTANIIFNPYQSTPDSVLTALSNITYSGGGTATKSAIRMVRDMVVQSQHEYEDNIKSIVFLMTDGMHNVGGNPEDEAKILKSMDVEIFVMGLFGHRGTDRRSMARIASPGEKHLYYLAHYESMEYLVDELIFGTIDYSYCGISARIENDAVGRIYGGVSSIKHWPWMAHVSIRKSWSNKIITGTCGGSIIDSSWILSAAQCFQGSHIDNVTVTVGVLDLDQDNDGDRQTRSVERIWKHPLLNPNNFDYDLALLKLKTPLRYGKYIRRICLPPNLSEINQYSQLYGKNDVAVVIGFGLTEEGTGSNQLREVDILIQNDTTCAKSIENHNAEMTERMICAGDPEGLKDPCKGDAGGPLMQEVFSESKLREPFWFQVGVASWSIKGYCAKKGYYGFYTHLSKLTDSVVQEIYKY